jgi:hypothetical protein
LTGVWGGFEVNEVYHLRAEGGVRAGVD